jgi:hypothetical protein
MLLETLEQEVFQCLLEQETVAAELGMRQKLVVQLQDLEKQLKAAVAAKVQTTAHQHKTLFMHRLQMAVADHLEQVDILDNKVVV